MRWTLAVMVVLGLAACGGSDGGDTSPTTEAPATTETAPPSTSMTLPADVCQQRDDAGLPPSPHCP